MADAQAMLRAMQASSGVISGNFDATITLMIIVLLSLILVVLTIIIPALPSVRRASARLRPPARPLLCCASITRTNPPGPHEARRGAFHTKRVERCD
jgi:hypothetical protein